MTDSPTQPTADHLLALVHAFRRADTDRMDALMAPWSPTPAHAGVLVLSLLDLASRVAAYMGGAVTYTVREGVDSPVGVTLIDTMARAVAEGDAARAYGAFIVTSTDHPNPDEWLPVTLAAAISGLDGALRLTPA